MIATNPAHSWIDQSDARGVLGKLDFLVVQDMYHSTDTAEMADLQLPAAGWGEKEGTLINSERRYGRLRQVRKAPGEALSDFRIFQAIARYWGCADLFDEWTDPEAVFRVMQRLSADRPADISGLDGYAELDREGGVQWPKVARRSAAEDGLKTDAAERRATEERRLFEDGRFYHADGRARLIVDDVAEPPEVPSTDYPLWLLTGRGTVSQWHTQTRTAKSPVLRTLYPNEPYVEVNPDDAACLHIANGDRVVVASRRGEATVTASVVPTVAPGTAFMPMHDDATNRLTLAHFDPHSRQPSYKDAAVRITAADPRPAHV